MSMEMRNGTTVQEFILEGFSVVQHLGKVLFLVHLLAYLGSIAGNAVIVTITCTDFQLQAPMYFFLSIFSFLEYCFICTVIPKLLLIFLLGRQNISFAACFIQDFFFIFLGAAGFLLIAVMSLDQYMAICKPLHYSAIMNLKICFFLVTDCFALGFTLITSLIVKVSQLSFCGSHVISHFFCDLGPLTHLSCSDTRSIEMLAFVLTLCILLTYLIISIFAYSNNCATSISQGATKSFLHLLISPYCSLSDVWQLCLYICKTKANKQARFQQEAALVNTVTTPLLNPVIYTLQNKQIYQALRRMMCRMKISK